jgi:hypothetical protein
VRCDGIWAHFPFWLQPLASRQCWLAISHSADANGNFLSGEQTLQRLRASDDFMKMVQEKMHPGMTVVLTDAPLHPDTRTGKDFVIMS